MKDSKIEVITRMLDLARVIRRRGTPEQAQVVLLYEQQFERDLAERERELAETQPHQEAA